MPPRNGEKAGFLLGAPKLVHMVESTYDANVLWRTVAGVVCFVVVVLGSLALIPELLYPALTDAQLSGVTGC